MSLLPEATEGGRGLEMMAFTFKARRRKAWRETGKAGSPSAELRPPHCEGLTDSFVSLFDGREACCLLRRLWAWRWKSATLTGRTPPEASRKRERPSQGETRVVCRAIIAIWNERRINSSGEVFCSTGWRLFSLLKLAGKSTPAQILFHHHDRNREETSTYIAALIYVQRWTWNLSEVRETQITKGKHV